MEFIDLKSQQKLIKDKIDKRIQNVLAHGQYIMGPEVYELEEKLADYVGVRHCISTSSGTDALLMAKMALDIKPGDEVILPTFTWVATAETILMLGAIPVFVDIDERTYNIDASKIEACMTEKTKAIIPVSLYGQMPDMDKINALASKYNIPVIEDAAQSFGATQNGKKSCSISTIACTSFFPAKPLGCYGDGGACFTNDDELAEKMRWIRIHGQKTKGDVRRVGINGRLDTIQAAILQEKFAIFPEEVRKRQEVAHMYHELLPKSLEKPYIGSGNTSVYAQYVVKTRERDALRSKLKEQGIPTAVNYSKPICSFQVYSKNGRIPKGFDVAKSVSDEILCLPMHPYLTKDNISNITSAFN